MQDNNFYENQFSKAEEIPPEETKTEENNVNKENFQPQIQYVSYIPYGFTPKTYEEKKDLRKIANTIALSLLIVMGISLLWGTAFAYVMMSMGFSYEKISKIAEDPAILQVMQVCLASFLFTIPFIIAFKIANYRISDLVSFKKVKKGTALPYFLIGLGFCSFANIAVSVAGSVFESFGINYDVDFGDNPQGFFGFLLSLIAMVIVPSLVEEFSCRGLMLGVLRKYGDGFAILVSSIMFGIMHGNFEQMPFAFLVGLILGFVAVKTGSLRVAILIHASNNFISVFFDYFMGYFNNQTQNVIYTFYLCLSMILGIIGVCILKNKDEDCFSLASSDTESTEKAKFKFFFATPLIIIYIVLSCLESLLYLK